MQFVKIPPLKADGDVHYYACWNCNLWEACCDQWDDFYCGAPSKLRYQAWMVLKCFHWCYCFMRKHKHGKARNSSECLRRVLFVRNSFERLQNEAKALLGGRVTRCFWCGSLPTADCIGWSRECALRWTGGGRCLICGSYTERDKTDRVAACCSKEA
ncbi:GP2 [Guinea pig adenovirus]|nr:GP2 [Guinea pig adenovirus]